MKKIRFCRIEGCVRAARSAGYCSMHYKRFWRHGNAEKTIISFDQITEICHAENCENLAENNQVVYCKLHNQRLKRFGRLENIKGEYGKGSDYIDANGYKIITIDGKTKYEHIYLAEKALGKKLPPGAVVHHMNENKTDNYTNLNLVICPDQAYHLLIHENLRKLKKKYPELEKEVNTDHLSF